MRRLRAVTSLTLLAASARRFNVIVITENYDNFNAMHRYIRGLKIVKGSDFFK